MSNDPLFTPRDREPKTGTDTRSIGSEPLFDSFDVATPRTIDEARLQMVHDLHRAVYGDTWARPEPPAVVWAELLDRVRIASGAFRRHG
jgi:hypothetical protein